MTFGINNGKSDVDLYQLGFGDVRSPTGETVFGEIELSPQVEQVGADMMLYVCKNQYVSTPFFKLHAPLGAMIVSSNITERNFVPFCRSCRIFSSHSKSWIVKDRILLGELSNA